MEDKSYLSTSVRFLFFSCLSFAFSCGPDTHEEFVLQGNSLLFNGHSGEVYFYDNDGSLNPPKAISICMWINLSSDIDCDNGNNWRGLLVKDFSWVQGTGYDVILEEDLSLSWSIATTGGSIRYWSAASTLSVGEWTYLTFVYDSTLSQADIYINGVAVNGEYGTTGSGDIVPSYSDLRLNTPSYMECPQDAGNFPGLVDEMSIWSISLSPSQIQENMNLILNGDEDGLISYWNFNENWNDYAAYDLAGNNNGYISGEVRRSTIHR